MLVCFHSFLKNTYLQQVDISLKKKKISRGYFVSFLNRILSRNLLFLKMEQEWRLWWNETFKKSDFCLLYSHSQTFPSHISQVFIIHTPLDLIKKNGRKILGLSALWNMQTNKLKSGRSGTNPIIRENLISLTSVADAIMSLLPSPSPVLGQWLEKLANKIRKFNYCYASPSPEIGCHTSLLPVLEMCYITDFHKAWFLLLSQHCKWELRVQP